MGNRGGEFKERSKTDQRKIKDSHGGVDVGVTHRAGGEGAVLREPLLVSEARGRGVVRGQGGVVVVVVGLVRGRRRVVVVVVGRVVGRRLLHAGVRRLAAGTKRSGVGSDAQGRAEGRIDDGDTHQGLPGGGGAHAVVIIPHVVVVRLKRETQVLALPVTPGHLTH